MVKLVPLPKETFTSLVTVIKARKRPAKEEKQGEKTNYKKGERQKATETGLSCTWVWLTDAELIDVLLIYLFKIVLSQCKDHSIIYFSIY